MRPTLPRLKELARGTVRAVTNAEELLQEAKVLFDGGHYARAYALATLCFEEVGKAMVISRLIYTDKSDIEGLKSFWQRFRSHQLKLGNSMLFLALFTVVDKNDIATYRWTRKHLSTLKRGQQSLKELSLYVDFEKGRFTLPSEKFMGTEPNAKTQIRLSEWTLNMAKERFLSETNVLRTFKSMRRAVRKAGVKIIKYNDWKTLLETFARVYEKAQQEHLLSHRPTNTT